MGNGDRGIPVFFENEKTDGFQEDIFINDEELCEKTIKVIPLKDTCMFPRVVMPLLVNRKSSLKAVDDAVVDDKIVSLHFRKGVKDEDNFTINSIGVLSVIHSLMKLPREHRIIVQGIKRVKIKEIIETKPYILAKVEPMEDIIDYDPEENEAEAYKRQLGSAWQKFVKLSGNMPEEMAGIPLNISDYSILTDTIALYMPVDPHTKQDMLETLGVKARMKKVLSCILREIELIELSAKVQNDAHGELSKSQKEYFLREQIKAIKKELGDYDDADSELDEFAKKIDEAKMPEEAEKQAKKELSRLERINPASPEYTVASTYIDWLVSLPWDKFTDENIDIKEVKKALDRDHYGLEDIKDRILEYLSVVKFKKDKGARHPILCLVGPPGVGKTSLGKSIANAIGRKFVRISLGGVRDEAEIRGHRRTYIGALPGQIIQGMKRAQTCNPLFMLDEIDKLNSDMRGDPASALLEVLDPEQNSTFRDHYIEVTYDLSKVFFVTTANTLETISGPLRDRMEILELSGYTEEEKFEIAKRHLIPKQLEEHGLTKQNISFAKDGVLEIIRSFTREAGVRTLERKIASVCRKVARMWAEETVAETVKINKKKVLELLGAPRYVTEELDERVKIPGVMVGMAWTMAGGDILYIEATKMPGKGNLAVTGQLGDVMKESAQIAYSYIKANAEDLGLDPKFYENIDIHIHVPAGATPKDGPSAGVTLTSAILSLLTGRKATERLSMTGEVTLRGKVLPIGGVKEKLLAASRVGIKDVIVPFANMKDVKEEVPAQVLEKLNVHYVKDVNEVFDLALTK
ncbi:MAG: endopeptidase La [Armatimonadetes bacterium]|nr:endopeptidase La [Candidatus Hippobium faecium]